MVANLPAIGTTNVEIKVPLGALDRGMSAAQRKASKGLDRIHAKVIQFGKRAGLVLGGAIALFGVSTVRASAKFEKSMNRVLALTDANTRQFKALNIQAKELGATTVFSASQAADAMGNLALAGFRTNEIIGAMPGVLQLAAAAQIDVASAAGIAAKSMRGFGLDASQLQRINDTLVRTFTRANTDLIGLGEAMKFVGPVARNLGVTFEQTAAAIAFLSDAGIQGAMAGTGLRGVLSKMINPAKEAEKVFDDLGIKVKDAEGNFIGLIEAIEQLERAMPQPGQLFQLFQQRGAPVISVLIERGSEALKEFVKDLEDAEGIAAKIAKIQLRGLAGDFVILKSAVEGLQIAIGDAGLNAAMSKLVQNITSVVRVLGILDKDILSIGFSMGKFTTLLAGGTAALFGLGLAAKVTFTALSGLPAVLVIGGIVAFSAALLTLIEDTERFVRIREKLAAIISPSARAGFSEEASRLLEGLQQRVTTAGRLFREIEALPNLSDELFAKTVAGQRGLSRGDVIKRILGQMETLADSTEDLQERLKELGGLTGVSFDNKGFEKIKELLEKSGIAADKFQKGLRSGGEEAKKQAAGMVAFGQALESVRQGQENIARAGKLAGVFGIEFDFDKANAELFEKFLADVVQSGIPLFNEQGELMEDTLGEMREALGISSDKLTGFDKALIAVANEMENAETFSQALGEGALSASAKFDIFKGTLKEIIDEGLIETSEQTRILTKVLGDLNQAVKFEEGDRLINVLDKMDKKLETVGRRAETFGEFFEKDDAILGVLRGTLNTISDESLPQVGERVQALQARFQELAKAIKANADQAKESFDKDMLDALEGFGRNFSREMAKMVATGKGSFKKLAQSFIEDFLEKVIQRLITSPLISFFENLGISIAESFAPGSGGNAGDDGGFGGSAKNPFNPSSVAGPMNKFTMPQLLPLFAGGGIGSFTPQIPTGFAAPPVERLTPTSRGEGTVINIIHDASQTTIQTRQSQQGGRSVQEFVIGIIADNIENNGRVAQAEQRVFGLRRAGALS